MCEYFAFQREAQWLSSLVKISLHIICTIPDSILKVLPKIALFSLVDIFDYFALQRVAQWFSSLVKISLHIIRNKPDSIFVIVQSEIVLFSLVDILLSSEWLSLVEISLHIIADSAQTEYCPTFLLYVRPSVCPCVTGVISHISYIYKGINAMLIIRGPIKPCIL